jgi:hypothetical protein
MQCCVDKHTGSVEYLEFVALRLVRPCIEVAGHHRIQYIDTSLLVKKPGCMKRIMEAINTELHPDDMSRRRISPRAGLRSHSFEP